MAYIDTGKLGRSKCSTSETAVFLHGNLSSSYLWRNNTPHLSDKIGCVAPDLMGMGKAEKAPNLQDRFANHIMRYLGAFFDAAVADGQAMLVLRDWGL